MTYELYVNPNVKVENSQQEDNWDNRLAVLEKVLGQTSVRAIKSF
jgi:hypothetical protein